MPAGYGRWNGLGSVSRPLKPRPAGSYRTAERRGDGTGGTVYPTVLEAYNRDSDYKRWRAGWDYWQGSGKSWGDIERFYLVRTFRDFGAVQPQQTVAATYFPSSSSPDGAWIVTCRRRGSIVLPQALQKADMMMQVDHPNPARHRLALDVSNTLSSAQLRAWQTLIGDQFEDSATGLGYPLGLISEPLETIAYTLADVDVASGKLLFDVSRPFIRRQPDRSIPQAYWQRLNYDRTQPLYWHDAGARYLCSSHRFFCTCPDFSGSRIANLSSASAGSQSLFPRPGAGSSVTTATASELVGYRTSWRELSRRADERRECKHIHAARWSVGYPYYEPSDYAVGDSKQHFQNDDAAAIGTAEIYRYHALRELTLDRLAPALANSLGVIIDPQDTASSEELAAVDPDRRPVLWATSEEPEASRAVADDWWVQRGTGLLRVFNSQVGRFVESVAVGADLVPVVKPAGEQELIA